MTEELHREDAYLRRCNARVEELLDGGVVLDRTVFYALGGGQPGDSGTLQWEGGTARIVDTRKGDGTDVVHLIHEGDDLPPRGARVEAEIDWGRRYRHMRMHTALHLLGAVLPYGVTGGNISEAKSRLDFDMEDTVDKPAVESAVNQLVEANHNVSFRWITDEELDAEPELVRTMSVQPPRGAGRVRLLEVDGVDLQPCGGTHVRSTGEIGPIKIGKVEKKGKHNRRVNIHLVDASSD